MTSDFRDFPKKERKPSLSEREREGGGAKTLPPLSLLTLPQNPARELAAYAGSISRWCDLTGNVPDITLGQDKAAAELAAFDRRLDQLAAEARRVKERMSGAYVGPRLRTGRKISCTRPIS